MKTTQLSKVAPAPDGNPQSPVLCWRHGLQLAVLVLAGLWAQIGMAINCAAPVTNIAIPNPTRIRADVATGALVWRSPFTTTRFTCTGGPSPEDMQLFFNTQNWTNDATAVAVDASQIQVQVEWSRAAAPGAAAAGVQGGTVSGTATINNTSRVQIGSSTGGSSSSYTVDVTWRLALLKGTAPTNSGLSGLPANVRVFQVDGSVVYPVGSFMTLSGLPNLRLLPTTCSISAPPVNLPGVVASFLSVAGSTAGERKFSIQLNNCTEGAGGAVTNARNVRVYFDGPLVDAASGRLNIDAGGAGNVQLQLLNDNAGKSVINLAGATGTQNVDTLVINAGSVTLPYIARYYAIGSANPGTVNTRVNFTVEYP